MSTTDAGDGILHVTSAHEAVGTSVSMDMQPVLSAIAPYTEGVSVTPPAALRAPGHIEEHKKKQTWSAQRSTSP
jgi:hypothetical protein